MQAAVLYAPQDLRIEEAPVPAPGPGQVLIRVVKAGICATDVEVFAGQYPAKLPLIMGHEYSGVVEKTGEGAVGIKQGDLVTSEASYGCGACSSCLAGRLDRCQSRMALGRSVDGAFAQFVRVPAAIVHRLPGGVSHEEGQLVVNLACVCRAIKRAEIAFGEQVFIIGSGQAALLMVQALKASGAGFIGLVGGGRPRRLELARELGADEVIAGKSVEGQKRLAYLAQKEEVDVVIEASGSPPQLEGALKLVKPAGKVVVFSIFTHQVENFNANLLYFKEPLICGSRGGAGMYALALDLLRKKKVRVGPLISHQVSLADLEKGIQAMLRHDPEVVRVSVNI
jgi:threonine dehydrogenase-like Zn-dependent dehydrogenase